MSSDAIDPRTPQGSTTADGPPALRAQMQSVPEYFDYKMSRKCPGVALIFNHVNFDDKDNYGERKGSDKDAAVLEKVLLALGFKVDPHRDLTENQVIEELEKVSKTVDHTDHDCLVVVMMTHGEKGTLVARDTNKQYKPAYKVERLWEKFDDNACPGLAGKPKMVFIQACRGEGTDHGQMVELMRVGDTVDARSDDKGNACSIPTIADLLVAYSTCEGQYSWRHPENGSWFIQELAKSLTEYGSKKDVMSLLTVVLRNVACNYISSDSADEDMDGVKQMPCIVSTLTKFVRFSSRLQGSTTADRPPAVRAQVQSHERRADAIPNPVPTPLEQKTKIRRERRSAIIFNHVNFDDKNYARRDGSKKDANQLKDALVDLGFGVRVIDDLTQNQVFDTLHLYSRNEDHTDHDCLVVVMMTHGENGTLMAKDTNTHDQDKLPYKVERLWEHFDDNACPGLVGKPKLVFIQASRGEQLGEVFSTLTIPNLLVVYSTYDGYYTRRNPTNGSCFIQSLAENLTEYGTEKDVLSLLTEAYVPEDENMDQMKQMPVIKDTLTKPVRFD